MKTNKQQQQNMSVELEDISVSAYSAFPSLSKHGKQVYYVAIGCEERVEFLFSSDPKSLKIHYSSLWPGQK